MDFGRRRGFLLDGEDPPEKVGCGKESYFLEFMNVNIARVFFGVVFHILFGMPRAPIITGTVAVLSPHIRSTSIFKSVFVKLFRGFD